jgi:Sec-independent protein translocase protein TatA
MYPAAHIHPPIDLVSSGDSPMLTPQNLILNRPILAPLPHAEPGLYNFVPSLASLPGEFRIAAPSEEDEEEDELDPEDTEDHIDDEDDDDDDQVIEDEEEDEEEDEDDDEEDEEHDPDSDSVDFFQQPSRSMPRSRRVQ